MLSTFVYSGLFVNFNFLGNLKSKDLLNCWDEFFTVCGDLKIMGKLRELSFWSFTVENSSSNFSIDENGFSRRCRCAGWFVGDRYLLLTYFLWSCKLFGIDKSWLFCVTKISLLLSRSAFATLDTRLETANCWIFLDYSGVPRCIMKSCCSRARVLTCCVSRSLDNSA